MILVAAQCDRERKISREKEEQLTSELGIKYLETSAKTGQNCEQVFIELVKEIEDSGDEKNVTKSYFSS